MLVNSMVSTQPLLVVPANGAFLADMVLQRMGIALLPQYYTDMLDPNLFAAVPLEKPNIQWHLVMAWKKIFLSHQRYKRGLVLFVSIFSTLSPNVEH